jgi:hypothetical protein
MKASSKLLIFCVSQFCAFSVYASAPVELAGNCDSSDGKISIQLFTEPVLPVEISFVVSSKDSTQPPYLIKAVAGTYDDALKMTSFKYQAYGKDITLSIPNSVEVPAQFSVANTPVVMLKCK